MGTTTLILYFFFFIMAEDLKEADQWAVYNAKGKYLESGEGYDALKDRLPDDACEFVFMRINAKGIGNTGKDQDNYQNIILCWKGPEASAMKKVKFNGKLQHVLENVKPNNGHLECLGKKALTAENIIDRIRPGSGSKVIEADS